MKGLEFLMPSLRRSAIVFGGFLMTALLFWWMARLAELDSSVQEPATSGLDHEHRFGVVSMTRSTEKASPTCKESIAGARQYILGHRYCNENSDCRHVRSGWVSMTAINKAYSNPMASTVDYLNQVCGHRISHDAFYSDYGIEIACKHRECIVSEITADMKAARMTAESLRTLDQSDTR